MAGHSKWANIKFRKAGQDAKRGKIFTKLIREITVAAKLGGVDIGANPRLRAAVDKALSANMKRDVIDRAIKRGAGGEEGQDLEEVVYEGYGPGGVAVMVACLTDNRNRTVAEVRHAFTKHSGNLGTDGSVAYLFTKMGQIVLDKNSDEEAVMELVLEEGADDIIRQDDGTIEVQTQPEIFLQLKTKLEQAQYSILMAEIALIPSNEVDLGIDDSEKVMKLIDRLEDLDDVQTVSTNAAFAQEFLEQLDA